MLISKIYIFKEEIWCVWQSWNRGAITIWSTASLKGVYGLHLFDLMSWFQKYACVWVICCILGDRKNGQITDNFLNSELVLMTRLIRKSVIFGSRAVTRNKELFGEYTHARITKSVGNDRLLGGHEPWSFYCSELNNLTAIVFLCLRWLDLEQLTILQLLNWDGRRLLHNDC